MDSKKTFTSTFRIKLEASLRLMQMHVINTIHRMGMDVSLVVQDEIYSDVLTVLWKTRRDGTVLHVEPPSQEYSLFSTIITAEFNKMNQEVHSIQNSALPAVMMLNKYELIVVSTCDRIVDLLNAEFALAKK